MIFQLTEFLQRLMIISGLSGETGANPVRARRRKAYMKCHEPDPVPHTGKRHWNLSEKAGAWNAKSKYPDRQSSIYNCECRFSGEIITEENIL